MVSIACRLTPEIMAWLFRDPTATDNRPSDVLRPFTKDHEALRNSAECDAATVVKQAESDARAAGQFADALANGPVVLDGGLATELEARGHDLSGALWSAGVLAADPDAIRQVHEAYFAAGAQVAISASYQASRRGFARLGFGPEEADALMVRSVDIAGQARRNARALGVTGPLFVAASVGPYGATLADGSEYRGRYGLPHEDLVRFHTERLMVLAESGADLLAIETIPDAAEAAAVVEALAGTASRRDGEPSPCWISFSCADGEHTNGGDRIGDAIEIAVAAPGIAAVGVNCTAPEHVASLLRRAREVTDLPLIAYPNAGRVWDARSRTWSAERATDGSVRLGRELVQQWLDAGAAALGGCCGLGPAAIGDLAVAFGQP
jgi:homocysteine S-methyltransferase